MTTPAQKDLYFSLLEITESSFIAKQDCLYVLRRLHSSITDQTYFSNIISKELYEKLEDEINISGILFKEDVDIVLDMVIEKLEEKEKVEDDQIIFDVTFTVSSDRYIGTFTIAAPTKDFSDYLCKKIDEDENYKNICSLTENVITGRIWSSNGWGLVTDYVEILERKITEWSKYYRENLIVPPSIHKYI